MCVEVSFEDGLLVCLRVMENAGSLEEARRMVHRVLEAYREEVQESRVQAIAEQLGVWGVI